MKPRKVYESKDGDGLPCFDKVMRGLLAVPRAELEKELAKHERKKARKKRAKKPASHGKV